jgi:hypothetical protein
VDPDFWTPIWGAGGDPDLRGGPGGGVTETPKIVSNSVRAEYYQNDWESGGASGAGGASEAGGASGAGGENRIQQLIEVISRAGPKKCTFQL